MTNILSRLRGGDRRSIGKVNEVVTAVQKKPGLIKDLVDGLFDDDPVVRMRAADALEKISGDNRHVLQPFKTRLIRLAQEGTISTRVIRAIEELTRIGSPAIQSRGKKLLIQLHKLPES